MGKYRASAEIKQQWNQWGTGLMNNAWRGVLPTTPFEALQEEAQTSIKYAGGGQIIGPLITCRGTRGGIGTRTSHAVAERDVGTHHYVAGRNWK